MSILHAINTVTGRSLRRQLFACAALLAGFCSVTYGEESKPSLPPYRILAPVSGGDADGIWDYATIDSTGRRLYLAQGGATVLDIDTGKVTPHFISGKPLQGVVPTHHVLPINNGAVLAVSYVAANAVEFFDSQTGKFLHEVVVGTPPGKNWHNPDQLLFEPQSQSLISVAGDSSSISVIDTTTFTKRAEIPVGKGKLEAATANGRGIIYVNEAERGRIAVIDVLSHEIVDEFAMKGCEEPTGMAFDQKEQMVLSVCSNGVVKFLDSKNGQELASVKVGEGADGIVFDEQRHFLFSFGGKDGTISIIEVSGRNHASLVQTLKTKRGARLGALDSKTGRIYIPSASFGPPAADITLPGIGKIPGLNPHTFEFIVVAPSSQ